jgi:CcmD family protein
MIWASRAAPYIVAAYAMTSIVILAYVASIRARRSALRRDLAAALEALDGFQGGPSGGQTHQRADSTRSEDDLGPT